MLIKRISPGGKVAAMNIERFTIGLVSALVAVAVFAGISTAQSPPRAVVPASNLNQLMRGLFFVHANVVFSAQRKNPAEIKWTSEPSASTDPLTGVFGNWEAVENSALVLIDSADLLMTPGRKCSNGMDVPVGKADWAGFVNELREGGKAAYKAAQSKNMDNIIEASDVLNTSCSDCHNKYRPRAIENRCK
jgi:hypothetical protein